jgi:hypothetical protein
MAQKLIGAQTDFTYGEVDVTFKRNDAHPARKAGTRQCANMRILNSKALQNRPGRAAQFPATDAWRIEEVTMSPGNVFRIWFGTLPSGSGQIRVLNSLGVTLFTFSVQGNGALLPWTAATYNQIVYAVLGLSIYITFPGMRPQILAWNGASTWTLQDYNELTVGGQKRTWFYRISPQGITLQPGAQTGSGISLTASAALFTPAHVGTRIRFVNRQMLITQVNSPTVAIVTITEALPGAQVINFATDPRSIFSVGDVVTGSVTASKGIVVATSATTIQVQLLTLGTSTFVSVSGQLNIVAFSGSDVVVGPGGSLQASSANAPGAPQAVTFWDEEVMNPLQGYPASCFVDQFRLGFCNFPTVPNGIGWSAINAPTDQYVVGASQPSGAMFELAPDKVQVRFVAAGPESSEFVFCDHAVYYIKIDAQNPLKPGSVSFQTLSNDGAAAVQPRPAQGLLFYVNAGGSSVMAISAPGAYYRPFETNSLTEFHSHLFGTIRALAAPNADTTFEERYLYALSTDGTMACGRYEKENGDIRVGWVPWSGAGVVTWIAALNASVMFTTNYFGSIICETLDDTKYLDAGLFVNAPPAAFAPPGGKGPMWWMPSQQVVLMDQGTRSMGTYDIDGNGFIVPQGNAGEDLTAATLITGQQWTATVEPFCPHAPPGQDAGQRMKRQQMTRLMAYVIHSTGFVLGYLNSADITRTSPPLGTLMGFKRFPAYNQDDDPTKPPPERETAEGYPPPGSTFDPRGVFIKDTPGPLQLLELTIEVSI